MTEAAFIILTAQIRSGDKRALSFVFDQTNQYCVRTLVKKTRCDVEDAEDVYMDALLVFREKVLSGKLTHLSNVQTYMFGICYNLWRDLNRAHAKWGKASSEIERQYMLLKAEEGLEEEEDLNKEKLASVTGALARLGEKCRKLLTYAYVEERSQQEIAKLMGFANANVVKVSRYRCYQKWMKEITHEKQI